MLNLKIEKEVESKHVVIRSQGWDLRQTISILVAVVIVAVFWYIADLDIYGIAIVALPFAILAYMIGWKEEAGLKIEDLLVKYMQKSMYKNERRGYHTRNGYVDLMNKAYTKMKNYDLADKKTARMIENQKKREQAKKKVSKYKSYM